MTVNIKNWQELKKPNALEVKPGNDPKRRATFVAEPLERGFGLTLLIGLWYEPVQKAFEMIRRRRTDVYQMRRMTVVE